MPGPRQTFTGNGVSALWGQRREVLVPAPAAGANWSYLLPSGYLHRVQLGHALLITSAQVASRQLGVQITDSDGALWWKMHQATGIPAAKHVHAFYNTSTTTLASGPAEWVLVQLPEILLPAGFKVESFTTEIQTEDQYSDVRLLVEQLVDHDPAQAPGFIPDAELHHDLLLPVGQYPHREHPQGNEHAPHRPHDQ